MYNDLMNRRVAVRAVITYEGKLFCLRLKPYRHKDAPSYWCTPGGGLDDGEAIIPALEREIIEELGVRPVIGNLIYVQQFIHKDVEQMELFFHVTNTRDFLNVDLSKTSHGKVEIEEVRFIDITSEHILPEFLKTESFDNIAAQPTQFFNYL